MKHPESPHAFRVDEVLDVIAVSQNDISPVQDNDTFNQCVDGLVNLDERTLHLLSPERLLLERERAVLDDFLATEQNRMTALEAAP